LTPATLLIIQDSRPDPFIHTMKRKIELLAPGGDIDAIKAAIAAGADAIYCGLNKFNARNRAKNLNFDDLNGVLNLAHGNNCKVYLTLNIIIVENEIPSLITLLILTEVFVHGSYCISFSGICYMSSVLGGKSGNRGRCSQPCRDRYVTTPEGKNFPLNLKDNSAYLDLREISDAGVASLKIEGRIKKLDYVYTVVNAWKNQIRSFDQTNKLNPDNSALYKVFNRDFSNSYLKGEIHKQMFIDNPRDHSIQHLSKINHYFSNHQMLKDQIALFEEKKEITSRVKKRIKHLSIAKSPITIHISGKVDTPLKVTVKTPNTSFTVLSEIHLVGSKTGAPNPQNGQQKDATGAIAPAGKNPFTKNKKSTFQHLDYSIIFKRLKSLNNTEYYIKNLDMEHLQNDLFIPFKELTSIKKKILFILNGSKEIIEPIEIPRLKKKRVLNGKPDLAVLISSQKDLHICHETGSQIFFEIPNCFKNEGGKYTNLFLKNNTLMPWFPSILIGENYSASVEFLQQVQPEMIVTNNTGIAYEACKNSIPWIAGPHLNIVNSFGLLCLKERFGGYGSFISNEISKNLINLHLLQIYKSVLFILKNQKATIIPSIIIITS